MAYQAGVKPQEFSLGEDNDDSTTPPPPLGSIVESSSWDVNTDRKLEIENIGLSGRDDTATRERCKTSNKMRGQHKLTSWTGAPTVVNGGSGVINGGSSNSNRPPLPPAEGSPASSTTNQRQQFLERDYHLKNKKFLQQAAAASLKSHRDSPLSPSTINSNGNNKHYYASPSPNTKFRKRLQLKAIEEDDGHSFVVLDRSGNNDNQLTPTKNDNSAPISIHTSDIPVSPSAEDWTTTSIRFGPQDGDDISVMSSLAGSYVGAVKITTSNNPNNNNTNSNVSIGGGSIATERFEQEQEERFQQKKQDMERKLAGVFEQNSRSEDPSTSELIKSYIQELERERAAMLAQWKSEMMVEEERIRQEDSRKRLLRDCFEAVIKPCIDSVVSVLANAEVLLSNMPLTVGAVGLSWVTMGTVWFKFTEEMVSTCHHVAYFSDHCHFREFPGCFECEVNNPYYRTALYFHWLCSSVSALCCILFMAKVILAPNAVLDMLKNPTTSTPVGVWCIAMVCTFAGQGGAFGEIIVLATSCFHCLLAFWFLHLVLKFRLWADPGWFPNVVGISYAAVKTWIYFPTPGLILMTLCTAFFLSTFFISVVRVALNHKIAAPVCWIQLSAPSITLYALTLVSQPTRQEELVLETSDDAKHAYHDFLTKYFMPSQHFFMLLTMVGLISAMHSLWVRWPTFKTKPFSPAHVAFCFPTLSHTNAVQAYRASLNAYSSMPPESPLKKLLFGYWCLFLFSGSILNIVFTIKYIIRIPEWTKPNLTGEEEPPAPSNTIIHEMMSETGAREMIRQPFLSPAVLEANEAGVLVRVKRGTADYRIHGPFARTRRVSSLGFDIALSEMELREERARLLDYVAKNAPKKRNRTISVPGVFHLRGDDGRDVYGTFSDLSQAETLVRGHARSNTTIGASDV